MSSTQPYSLAVRDVEEYLSQHNYFCLVDWLIERSLLAYADYEQWRYGKLQYLKDAVKLDEAALAHLADTLPKLTDSLNLAKDDTRISGWNTGTDEELPFSSNPQWQDWFCGRWMRAHDIPQLDLFMDNSAVITENALQNALAARDFALANNELAALTEHNSKHGKLGEYRDLILYGEHIANLQHIDEAGIIAERDGLANEVVPLARDVLGQHARDYLAFAWRKLSENLAEFPSLIQRKPEYHPSLCLAQIPDWTAVNALLTKEPATTSQTTLTELYAKSCEQISDYDALVMAWAQLFEIDAEAAENAIEERKSLYIWEHWQNYWEHFEDYPTEYFPAYLFALHAGLVHKDHQMWAWRHAATAAMYSALETDIRQNDRIAARAAAKACDQKLLDMFIRLRPAK